MRDYKLDIPDYTLVIPVDDFLAMAGSHFYTSEEGKGYWVYDGKMSEDEVFSSDPENATDVAWFGNPEEA